MQGARAVIIALTKQYHTVLLKVMARWQYQTTCDYYQQELLISKKKLKKFQKKIFTLEKEEKKSQEREQEVRTQVVDLETERDALLLRVHHLVVEVQESEQQKKEEREKNQELERELEERSETISEINDTLDLTSEFYHFFFSIDYYLLNIFLCVLTHIVK